MCFLKWGHKWKKLTEEDEKEIMESLEMVGVLVDNVEVCSKCDKVKITARTFFNPEPFIEIMPPYPFERIKKVAG